MSDLKSAKKYAVPADDVFLAYHLKVADYPIELQALRLTEGILTNFVFK